MSQHNGRPALSEKGLLTPDNCLVAFVDLQPQMIFGVNGADREMIINHNVALAKATRVFGVPAILTTIESKSFSGYVLPQVQAVFPDDVPIERSTMNAWDDATFVSAVTHTGRRKILLAGLWTETCIALPAIQLIHDGYDV